MKTLIWIGLGGFFGSVSRFYIQTVVNRHFPSEFPWGTMVVNIIGCLIIGALYALAEKNRVFGPEMRLFLMVGFVGSFTTYSSFALEKFLLFQSGMSVMSMGYLIASIIAGLAGVYSGYYLVQSLA